MKQMTVGKLIKLLQAHDPSETICMMSRIRHEGTQFTAINTVAYEHNGNLVVTLDDDLLEHTAHNKRSRP